MNKEEFYDECARILGVEHKYVVPYSAYKYPNRWNNRAAGNGRFEGFGIIQVYSSKMIRITLHSPSAISVTVPSMEDALRVLGTVMGRV